MKLCLIASACAVLLPTLAQAETPLPPGFAYLRAVAPQIQQDMRYAGPRNFTGKPVAGYLAGECILLREPAMALKRAERRAAALGFSLKVYDCYRPVRAAQAFAEWAAAPDDGLTRHFYPRLQKSALTPRYIASRSGHSAGNAVDITLVPRRSAVPAPGGLTGDCTAPQAEREPDNSLDMGTGFDCFDPKSAMAAPGLLPAQRDSRRRLKAIMEAAGFGNYAREWWHYAYGGTAGRRGFDFPVKAMPQ